MSTELEKKGGQRKKKRLGIVSSYVTWMSNNFGARGCRISNVEAGRLQPQPGHRCHAPPPPMRAAAVTAAASKAEATASVPAPPVVRGMAAATEAYCKKR